ncbi:hypothetical protein, partial [Brucella intermedia]|uniref:hypothetical protein n=1 Tax=Brucella intermedia TaxID=94625 RepID=UPI0019D6B1D1
LPSHVSLLLSSGLSQQPFLSRQQKPPDKERLNTKKEKSLLPSHCLLLGAAAGQGNPRCDSASLKNGNTR